MRIKHMPMMKLAFCLLLSFTTLADARPLIFDVETGLVSVGYNDVQVPGKTGTRFSLVDGFSVDSKAFYRLRVTREVADNKFVSVLIAPLTLEAKGVTAAALMIRARRLNLN